MEGSLYRDFEWYRKLAVENMVTVLVKLRVLACQTNSLGESLLVNNVWIIFASVFYSKYIVGMYL